jgi:hypothetical protein
MRPFLTHFLDHLTGGEPIESILRQPATLYTSRTHVDLRLSLEQISISMRRAGLDHTPGWLPYFVYIVTIFFECGDWCQALLEVPGTSLENDNNHYQTRHIPGPPGRT